MEFNARATLSRSSAHLLVVFDALIVAVVALLSFMLLLPEESIGERYLVAVVAYVVAVTLCSAAMGLYNQERALMSWNVLRRMFFTWFIIIATIALLAVITKTNYTYSRSWFLITAGLSFSISLLFRLVLLRLARLELEKAAANSKVLVVGAGPLLSDTVQNIRSRMEYPVVGVEIVSWNDKLDTEQQLLDLAQQAGSLRPTQIWVIGRDLDERITSKVVRHFHSSLSQITYFPDFGYLPVIVPKVENIEGLPAISLSAKPLSVADRWVKGALDKALSIIVLLLLSPLYVILAIGVKLSSPGPVFYRQQRLTVEGKVFEMLKFRSMPVDAEKLSGPVWAKKGEQRATRFGGFIRGTSLDELPQFINVLRGDMSVVGPRPERPHFVEEFQKSVPAYMQKHNVRAGITGWAQVNGLRGNTSIEKRIEYDIFYIQNWSIWLDLKIIIMTLYKGLISDTAY